MGSLFPLTLMKEGMGYKIGFQAVGIDDMDFLFVFAPKLGAIFGASD